MFFYPFLIHCAFQSFIFLLWKVGASRNPFKHEHEQNHFLKFLRITNDINFHKKSCQDALRLIEGITLFGTDKVSMCSSVQGVAINQRSFV